MKYKKITYFRHYIPWTKIPDDMNKSKVSKKTVLNVLKTEHFLDPSHTFADVIYGWSLMHFCVALSNVILNHVNIQIQEEVK